MANKAKTADTVPPSPPAAPAPPCYSLADFCVAYSIGRTFAYQQIAAGKLIAQKAGDRVLVPREAAEAWRRSLPLMRGA